jgi:hypothetical protein
MFSSASFPQTPSAFILPLMWETRFHICTKPCADKVKVPYILIFMVLDSRRGYRRVRTEFPKFDLPSVSSLILVWICCCHYHMCELAMFSTDQWAIFRLWICSAFWLKTINIYLVFSVFSCRPAFLLASLEASVILFKILRLSPT